ncbi:putative sterigmatocystin biosynthesis P450 monooxygenase stcS-like protein 3 [Colletotrichum chlorophyti]|uniref:Putative sterigmatocystin biosynthesis P450 monooxygenase stcS-like protein 3 n=1 Tax=Colletotrichum chlorophyti TaxID=708187 RepID=A0A1Q8RQK1_9PEZI|nr:putative sterigmatocystin biosynthesis P450 monooxygenase stcS-like protein 3 [Colletotrichum chlorophyti]
MFGSPLFIALLALPALLLYLYSAMAYRRFKQYAHIPQVKPSLLWGHLKAINDFHLKRGEKDGQLDPAMGDMSESLGNPPVLLFDLRPISRPMLLIRTHDVAEQISRQSKMWPYSTPKSDTMFFLKPLLGERSIVMTQASAWKDMRKHFNPGFAPQHLMSLMPVILEKTEIFIDKLDKLASTGEEFELEPLCTNLTFDIIGAVTMDADLGAQLPEEDQSEFIKGYKEFLASYKEMPGILMWWQNPRKKRMRKRLSKTVNDFLADLIRRKFEDVKQNKGASSRSVLALSLKDTQVLTQDIIDDTKDQLKTFLFAGHDTTSILLQWAFYELSRTPRAMKTLRIELESLFGPDLSPEAVREALLSRGDEITPKMVYTSAVIKEILRLYPPAGSARRCPPGSNFYLQLPDGSSLCADGLVLYNCATLIQRDPEVYGSTKDDFVPERWLGNTDISMSTNNDDEKAGINKAGENEIPAAAWRPFERGPRNCIGQELANIEARVILASVVGKYAFEKVGLGAASLDANGKRFVNHKGQYHSDTQLYSSRLITARPVDNMRVRVRVQPTEL